jgi:hypothetical protein
MARRPIAPSNLLAACTAEPIDDGVTLNYDSSTYLSIDR